MRFGFLYTLITGFVFLAETLECIILFHFLFLKWGRRWIMLLLNSAVTFLLMDYYFGSISGHWATAPRCTLCPQNWDSMLWAPAWVLDCLWRTFLRELVVCITTKWFKISHPLFVLLWAFLYKLKNLLRRKYNWDLEKKVLFLTGPVTLV